MSAKQHGPVMVDAVVKDGSIRFLDKGAFTLLSKRAAQSWGDGRALKCRIEPEEDAYTYAQLKHYWGYIVTPFCETTGYHKHEAHLMLKAECMPEGKTSLTDLSREELARYAEAAEQTAREWCPDAFALYDKSA